MKFRNGSSCIGYERENAVQIPVHESPAVPEQTGKSAGRPRSEDSRRAILDATRRLLTHTAIQKLSIEGIAKKAGVGKTTIYRWWPNKQAVVMEAVFSQGGYQTVIPANIDPFEGICMLVERLIRQLSGKNGRIVAEVIGEAQGDADALRALTRTFFQERYDILARCLMEGRASGAFRADLDAEAAIDLILGPVFFRLITGQDFGPEFFGTLAGFYRRALS